MNALTQFQTFLQQEVGIDQQTAEDMCRDLEECSHDWLLLSIIDLMPTKDIEDFDHLVTVKAPQDVVTKFLYTRIPDIEEQLRERLIIFINDVMESIRELHATDIADRQRLKLQATAAEERESCSVESDTPAVIPTTQTIKQLNRDIDKAVKKSDWATAAKLIQDKKKTKKG